MNLAFSLLAAQIALGAFDSLWHHEIVERLPTRRGARVELALHAARELCYATLFAALAWWTWHGAWTFAFAALLAAELAITLADFVIEDATRRLPKLERIVHTVLAINFGALVVAFVPTFAAWARLPTEVVAADYGGWSWFLTACSGAVLLWSARNAIAAARHFHRPAWQRRPLVIGTNANPKQVLVAGATGFIGRRLVARLLARGDRVLVLARNRSKAADLFGPHAEIFTSVDAIPGQTRVDAVVNLAGEPIAGGLWTERRKRLLLGSRLAVTDALLALIARLEAVPTTWINASAIGYYGVRNDAAKLHEKSPPQPGFQSDLCRRCEQAAARAADHGVKVATLRIGIVLGGDGGALPALARPVRLGLGVRLGSGEQWVSWIHVDDLLDLALFVLDQETLGGPVNAVAPGAVTHTQLMAAIASTLRRRLLPFAMPARLLRALLGELAELFVDGQRVVPERATALGFRFRYAELEAALAAALASTADAAGGRGEEAEVSASSPSDGATGSATV